MYKGLEWLERLIFTPGGDLVIAAFHTVSITVTVLCCFANSGVSLRPTVDYRWLEGKLKKVLVIEGENI